MADKKNAWLEETHPIWDAGMKGAPIGGGELSRTTSVAERDRGIGPWLRNERRLRGGEDALDELVRFDWEAGNLGGTRYISRQAQATYINFPDLLATTIVGHLFRKAPTPERGLTFGALGDLRVGNARNPSQPTRAELLWYNADGVGNDGSQWQTFWSMQARLAMATGHRWIFVDSGARPPKNGIVPTVADEQAGRRPYLVGFGPDKVSNWHYEEGRLAFAVVRIPERRPRIIDGRMVGNAYQDGFMLLVRRQWDGFGPEYSSGGWWLFNSDGNPVVGSDNKPRTGNWDSTDGEIPLVPLFYERDSGTKERPAMSRSAVTELGQVAVSYMNLSSAADYDAWEAASSVQIITGADPEGFNIMIAKLDEGSRWAPLPSPKAKPDQMPQVHDGSMGAVTAEVFDRRLKQKFEEARQLALQEATSAPDSSGESKRVGFEENKAPRLARFAGELEQTMNTALYFVERRWGIARPTAYTTWPREFDLTPVLSSIHEVFALQTAAGIYSPTLTSELLQRAIEEKRIIADDEILETIDAELTVAAFERQTQARQDQAFEDEVDDAGGGRPRVVA